MVQAMGMLSNSNRSLLSMQKYLLYRTCILPVTMYGYRLWYHDKAKVKGLMSFLSKMQWWAALWIIGMFRTSPTGGCKAIVSLIPIHLHICRLADWSSFRANTLSASHPLRTQPSLIPYYHLPIGECGVLNVLNVPKPCCIKHLVLLVGPGLRTNMTNMRSWLHSQATSLVLLQYLPLTLLPGWC
jgi:hypothetical protein